jgi:hypothetical protein
LTEIYREVYDCALTLRSAARRRDALPSVGPGGILLQNTQLSAAAIASALNKLEARLKVE